MEFMVVSVVFIYFFFSEEPSLPVLIFCDIYHYSTSSPQDAFGVYGTIYIYIHIDYIESTRLAIQR